MLTDAEARTTIADNVRRLLAERGMNQRDLAKATGESDMRVSLLCRGERIPSAAFLARVAEALEVSADTILAPPPKKSRKTA